MPEPNSQKVYKTRKNEFLSEYCQKCQGKIIRKYWNFNHFVIHISGVLFWNKCSNTNWSYWCGSCRARRWNSQIFPFPCPLWKIGSSESKRKNCKFPIICSTKTDDIPGQAWYLSIWITYLLPCYSWICYAIFLVKLRWEDVER